MSHLAMQCIVQRISANISDVNKINIVTVKVFQPWCRVHFYVYKLVHTAVCFIIQCAFSQVQKDGTAYPTCDGRTDSSRIAVYIAHVMSSRDKSY